MNWVGFLRLAGTISAVIMSVAIALGIMVGSFEAELTDGVLIGICAACTFAVVVWGIAGAKPYPNYLVRLLAAPSLILGICFLIIASERYPLLWPWLVGVASVAIFAAMASAVSWRSVGGLESLYSNDDAPGGRTGNLFLAVSIYVATGIFFFQPLVILLNGKIEARPPLVLRGTVAQAYQVNGKTTRNYVRLNGPAAAFSSTWTKGEFEVDYAAYRASPAGAAKCITLRTGLFRFRWWSIGDC